MERGRNNVSLDGVNQGIAAGDIGAVYRIPMTKGESSTSFSWQVVITGAPATIQVDLEGSLDAGSGKTRTPNIPILKQAKAEYAKVQ